MFSMHFFDVLIDMALCQREHCRAIEQAQMDSISNLATQQTDYVKFPQEMLVR